MYRNYFYLNRSVIELNGLLHRHTIRSIFSQEKDKLIIECTAGFEERFFIEICVNPGHPYITVREDFRRARKNVTSLFTEAEGSVIIEASIAVNDRIIRITASYGTFYFMIRGKYTNFVLLSQGNISFFKHHFEGSSGSLIAELQSKEYTSAFNFPSISSNNPDEIRTEFPIISKEVISEANSRNVNKEELGKVVSGVILEFIKTKPAVLTDLVNKDIYIAPESFHIFNFSNKQLFDSYFQAFNTYLGKLHQLQLTGSREKIIKKFLEREIHKLTSRIEKLKFRIIEGSKEEEYRKKGELLKMYRYSLHKGLKELVVKDIYPGKEKVSIKIDPSLSRQKNIDAYFDKAKNEKISYEKSVQLYRNAEIQLQRFVNVRNRFLEYTTKEELEDMMKELKIKDDVHSPVKEDPGAKFKQYIIDKIYYVYVGKDSKNNDLLTTKFAKQNDYWFHARSVSGSHVVLRNDKTKENIPKNILKKAASLAAYHSKAKTAGTVPVSYTLKKYVVKKKGMEAGKVALLKEEVLLVSPEIPEGAEFVSSAD